MVIVVASIMTAVISTAQEAGFTKILVIEIRGPIRIPSRRLIVVSHRYAIGHALCHASCEGIFNLIEGKVSVLPFDLKLISMLCAVA